MESHAVTLEKLIKDYSLELKPGMTFVNTIAEGETHFTRLDAEQLITYYSNYFFSNMLRVSYVVNEKIYVTPFVRIAVDTLKENRFTEEYFKIPMELNQYPKGLKSKWESLEAEAEKVKKEELIDDCIEYSNEIGIAPLSPDYMENCLEITDKGLKVKKDEAYITYYPFIKRDIFTEPNWELIGKYNTLNSITVFIDKEGKTYITKKVGFSRVLKCAGYRNKKIFVPMAYGEEIIDSIYKDKWDQLEA